jgi:hypothetical protein
MQRLEDEGDFGMYKSVPVATCSHNYPAAID